MSVVDFNGNTQGPCEVTIPRDHDGLFQLLLKCSNQSLVFGCSSLEKYRFANIAGHGHFCEIVLAG